MAARIVVCAAYPCKYNYSDNKKGRPAMILLFCMANAPPMLCHAACTGTPMAAGRSEPAAIGVPEASCQRLTNMMVTDTSPSTILAGMVTVPSLSSGMTSVRHRRLPLTISGPPRSWPCFTSRPVMR